MFAKLVAPARGRYFSVKNVLNKKSLSSTINVQQLNPPNPLPSSAIPEPSKGLPVIVKAYYMAREIDIMKISGSLYSNAHQEFQKKSVILTINESFNQYVTVFKYGSVVLFNIPTENHVEYLRQIKDATIFPIADELRFSDEYKVIVHDNLDKPSVIKAEHLNIRNLDKKNITIVGTVMAQAIALDYYAIEVDRQLEIFMKMNLNIQSTGDFRALSDQKLFKMVASNNIVITNVLSKLGLFEGSDAAWDNADYHYTWEALRKDFELDSTFRDLDLKLGIIKDDTRFFLEVLHNKKSTKLEWIIIILIGAEIFIGIYGIVN